MGEICVGTIDLTAFATRLSRECSPYWLNSAPRLREQVQTLRLPAAAVRSVFDRAKEHAVRNQKGRATNWLAAAFFIDQERTAALHLKRSGLLRASKYDFDPSIPRFLVEQILAHAGDFAAIAGTRSLLTAQLGLLRLHRRPEQRSSP
ncbi:MAG TPA: hypothetical protein VMN03_02890 [Burkholderiales bacterium]|nr:hypothetical protein [Burkholderiales bacterium]